MDDQTTTFDRRKERVETGVPGLDVILHGGLLRQAVYLVRGKPGAGKTILANQLCFNHVARGGKVLYVTLLSETHERMLFNLGQLSFFKASRIPAQLTYLSAYNVLEQAGLKGLSEMLRRETRAGVPSLLVVDGLVTVESAPASNDFKKFIHDMQIHAGMQGTTVVLLSSAGPDPNGPELTMVDGVIEVRDNRVGKRRERELEVSKFRGSDHLPGGHAFRITSDGLIVYPRLESMLRDPDPREPYAQDELVGTGVSSLDDALHGGVRAGSTTVLFGPTGSGKTTLGLHFLRDASAHEPGLHFGFYETPHRVLQKADMLGLDLQSKVTDGTLEVIWHPPTERELDALGNRLVSAVRARGVKRLFVDGIDGFTGAAADAGRIAHFFSALTNELRTHGVTALYSQEVQEVLSPALTLPLQGVSALVENILLLRYVEQDARLARLFTVVKLRERSHDDRSHELCIDGRGARLVPFARRPRVLRGVRSLLRR